MRNTTTKRQTRPHLQSGALVEVPLFDCSEINLSMKSGKGKANANTSNRAKAAVKPSVSNNSTKAKPKRKAPNQV